MAGIKAVSFNGRRLTKGAETWTVRAEDLRTGRRLALGDYLQTTERVKPGRPLLTRKLRWSARWRDLGPDLKVIEDTLATPGPWRFTPWRQIPVAYRGDGERKEFYLPRGWCLADLVEPTPHPSAVLDELGHHVVMGGEIVPLVVKEPGDYDGGEPEPGTAWVRGEDPGRDGEQVFKLGTAPVMGLEFVVRVTPSHWVSRAPSADDRELTGPSVEPLVLELWEG